MSDRPELVSIILCERVLQDLFRKDAVTLVNVHNQISSQAFPTIVPVLYAYAQFSGFPQSFTYQFKLFDPAGNLMAASSAGMVEGMDNSSLMHKVISTFPGLIFNTHGTHLFTLEVNEVKISSSAFQVDLVQVAQVAAV